MRAAAVQLTSTVDRERRTAADRLVRAARTHGATPVVPRPEAHD